MKSLFIIGPSGSGKSTLSQYLAQVYKQLFGPNSVVLVNLDPANPSHEQSQYDIDLNNLITIEDIMEQFEVGPNGAMLYAMDFLYENRSWLLDCLNREIESKQPLYKIEKLISNSEQSQRIQCSSELAANFTVIYDLPGQVELYLQNDSTKNLIKYLQKNLIQNTCILELFDATYIYQVNDFVSMCMISLVTMINLQMPHINVLNKIDVIKGQRPALGVLNEYFDFYSVRSIVEDLTLVDASNKKSLEILNSISDVIDQYNQVSFIPCSVYKIELVKYLLLQIQKSFSSHEVNKLNSQKYTQFIATVDKSYAKEEIITELQNQLFREEEEETKQEKQQIDKVLLEIKTEIDKSTSFSKSSQQ